MYYTITRTNADGTRTQMVSLEGQSNSEFYREAVNAYGRVAATRPVGTKVTLEGEDGIFIMGTGVREE